MATTALEALNLIREGKGRFEEMDHADPITDATVRWAVLDTGETVDLGEIRASGFCVIPGSLRGKGTDQKIVVECITPEPKLCSEDLGVTSNFSSGYLRPPSIDKG